MSCHLVIGTQPSVWPHTAQCLASHLSKCPEDVRGINLSKRLINHNYSPITLLSDRDDLGFNFQIETLIPQINNTPHYIVSCLLPLLW